VQLVLLALVADFGNVNGVAVRRDGQVVGVGDVLRKIEFYYILGLLNWKVSLTEKT
jgi:hypothetical protein